MNKVAFKAVAMLILALIIIITLFHFYKYINKTTKYEIIQQYLDNVNGNDLYMSTNPLVITFIEDNTLKHNIDSYSLKTALTIKENYISINPETVNYMSHNNEICLIRPQQNTTITLINPKFNHFFTKLKFGEYFKYHKLPEENYSHVNSIDIVLHKHNIYCVPRFWLFKFNDSQKVDIYLSHNIFTILFSYLI
tara:strand:- start:632 stop:1213 length:582 start_codon:yes stop_codon:yes gene_type:complete